MESLVIFPFPACALQQQIQHELFKRLKLQLPERNKPPLSCEEQIQVTCKWVYSKPSQIIAKNTTPKLNISAFMWFAPQAVHSPVSSSFADLILSLLIKYIHLYCIVEWPFKPPGEVNCPAIAPHPGNQTQIENIQLPISVRVSIFPACQYDVTFSTEPAGCKSGDNISGL